MEKVIYLDLDGTVADLYAVPNWLAKLRAEDVSPYIEAKPIYDLPLLFDAIEKLTQKGWIFGVISWTSKNGSLEYNKAVRAAKISWLKETGFFPYLTEIHCVKYGTPKHLVPIHKHNILIDDDREVREKWRKYGGEAIDPIANDIIEVLTEILNREG